MRVPTHTPGRIALRLPAGIGLALLAGVAAAAPWQFGTPVEVAAARDGAFHHLEAAGRRSVAANNAEVALTWEDDRDGNARVYLARKPIADGRFDERRLSGDAEAFEPSIAALPDGRFLVAWEEAGRIHARVPDGPVAVLDDADAAQAGLLADSDGAVLVYAARAGRATQIRLRRLRVADDGTITAGEACAIDPAPPAEDQLYPAAAWSGPRLVVAWEDRRPKHTIIMAAAELEPCRFSAPQRISQRPGGAAARSLPFGTGHGVSRVALGAHGTDRVFAAWADKRDFRSGYDIWGAEYDPTTTRFGDNQRVQDDFGELAAQWHASVVGDASGRLAVFWDDGREGNADLMLSWREDGAWSDDTAVPGASGEGEQAHPSALVDAAGRLHLVWIERPDRDGPTRVRYLLGTPTGE